MERAEQSPEVAARIGRPFRVGRLVSGRVNLNGDGGDEEISIPISGEHGSGYILARAKKKGGQWTFQRLEVHVDGSDTVIPWTGSGGAAPADDSV